MEKKLKEAYWEGYAAGNEFHRGSGYCADNPYDSRAVEVTQEEDDLVAKWQEGFDDRGYDS